MKIGVDLHTHTTISDGSLDLFDLIDFYAKRNIKAIAVTDHCHDRHGGYISKENFDKYLAKLEEGKKYAKKKYGMLLIPGVEVTSDYQGFHISCLPAKEYISPKLPCVEVLKKIKELGCFSIACHPEKWPWHAPLGKIVGRYYTGTLWEKRKEFHKLIDAWEAFNWKNYFHLNEFCKLKWNYVAGSDFHSKKQEKAYRMILDVDELSLKGIINAIKLGKKEIIFGFPENDFVINNQERTKI